LKFYTGIPRAETYLNTIVACRATRYYKCIKKNLKNQLARKAVSCVEASSDSVNLSLFKTLKILALPFIQIMLALIKKIAEKS
jgi:hypothetical protein